MRKRLRQFFSIFLLMEGHQHEFDYDNPGWDGSPDDDRLYKFYPCKQEGCGLVTSVNKDGSWAFDDPDGVKYRSITKSTPL